MKTIGVILFAVVLVVIVAVYLRSHRSASSPSVPSPPDDGRLRIRDLTIDDIRSGQNWKVTDPEEFLQIGETLNLEDIHIAKAEPFSEKDWVAYSALFLTESGSVSPLILIKEVGESQYGGDYCEMHSGKWRQVGLVPNPSAPHGMEYVANPLDQDPAFDTIDNQSDDSRAENRAQFRKWSVRLASTQPLAPAVADTPRR